MKGQGRASNGFYHFDFLRLWCSLYGVELNILPLKRVFDPDDPEPCAGCGDCCRYVTAQIKSPRSRVDYDEIRWFLLHENIQVFIDEDGWYIEFATRCRKLDGWRCSIY